jgi:predicted GNAT family acetyltransferase
MTEVNVVHNAAERQFEAQLDASNKAIVEYMRSGGNIIFTHTEVPQGFEGQGIANQLAKAALEYAKTEGLKVQPLCPFIKLYIQKHPEYQSISWGF